MSNSKFQDAAIKAILNCVKRGNKARFDGDGRKLTSFLWCEEFPTYRKGYTRRPAGRADLYVEIIYDKGGEWELSEDYIFECKSSVDDLESGYGLNFAGDRNFLVIPDYKEAGKYKSFVWKLKLERAIEHLAEIGRADVGVLVIKNGEVVCKKASWLNKPYGHLFQQAFGDYYDPLMEE